MWLGTVHGRIEFLITFISWNVARYRAWQNYFFLLQGYEDGEDSSAGGAMQKKRKGSTASSQGSKASATAGTGDKQTLKSEKEDGEKDEYADDFEEDKTEGIM
jgi:hypothetical protein